MTPDEVSVWSNGKQILFRFVFSYLVLYNFPMPLSLIPGVSALGEYYTELWHIIGVWAGKTFFHKDITVFSNGSGDTTYDYILIFCFFAVALIITFIWTLLDRKRTNYSRLFQFLHVYIRCVLALTMLSYGSYKVIQSQFPVPNLTRLLQPYGESSPMGLLWTFMGYSYAFNVFTGLGEMVGGLLLAFKRTTLLGAMVLVAVLSNVVILNFSFDVPVKLYSSHLLLMTFFLLLPNMERLLNFLLFNKTTEPEVYKPLFTRASLNRWIPITASLLVVVAAFYMLYQSQEARKQYGDLAPKSPFYGIWNVEEEEIAGELQPALISSETRWRRVILENTSVFSIQMANDTVVRYLLKTDDENKTFSLSKRTDPNWKSTFNYSQPDSDQIVLEGTFEDKPFRVKLKRSDKKFLLMDRGFNWINESPFNR